MAKFRGRKTYLGNVERVLRLQAGNLGQEAFRKFHAQVARETLSEFISERGGIAPGITTYVDSRKGASEDTVKFGGVIRYEFEYLKEIVIFCLNEAKNISPVDSGLYKSSWFLLGPSGELDPENLTPDIKKVHITNDQPYHRKIHMRSMPGISAGLSAPPGIVERLRQTVLKRYGNVLAEASVEFITLNGGYKLKRGNANRKDSAPGSDMTYPSLLLKTAW